MQGNIWHSVEIYRIRKHLGIQTGIHRSEQYAGLNQRGSEKTEGESEPHAASKASVMRQEVSTWEPGSKQGADCLSSEKKRLSVRH